MADNASIVILTTRGTLHYLLINALVADYRVAAVVYEERGWRDALRRTRYRARRCGLGATAGQVALAVWESIYLSRRATAYTAELVANHDVSCPDARVPWQSVPSINDASVAELLRQERPAVCVVSGTNIIRPPMLELCPVFLNIHAGITPRYRGCHGAFWALYEGRPDLAGVTVHMVDSGIDTGRIVAQAPIQVDPLRDTHRTLGIKQYLVGIDLMRRAVAEALEGRLPAIPAPEIGSKQWYSPTLADYCRWRTSTAVSASRSRRRDN